MSLLTLDPNDTRPIWLLDVDGVLNVSKDVWGNGLETGQATAEGTTWTLRWPPALIDHIRKVIKAGRVEVRWCTTWCSAADELERLWDLPVLPRAWKDARNGPWGSASKHQAAREVILSDRRLIWTDDGEADTHLGMSNRGALCIAPDRFRGLTPENIAAIDAYIAEHTG